MTTTLVSDAGHSIGSQDTEINEEKRIYLRGAHREKPENEWPHQGLSLELLKGICVVSSEYTSQSQNPLEPAGVGERRAEDPAQ